MGETISPLRSEVYWQVLKHIQRKTATLPVFEKKMLMFLRFRVKKLITLFRNFEKMLDLLRAYE